MVVSALFAKTTRVTFRTYSDVLIRTREKMPTPDQIRAARALLGLSQPQIAEMTGFSTMTVKRAEGAGQPPASASTVDAIRRALEKAGVIFVDENGEGPGVRLKKKKDARGKG
jgi:DNA-binding transcriptional regulator YiaG